MTRIPKYTIPLLVALFLALVLPQRCQGARGLVLGSNVDVTLLDSEPEVFKIRLLDRRSICMGIGRKGFGGTQRCADAEDLFFLTSATHPNYGGLQIQKLGTSTCLAATWQELKPGVSRPVVRMEPCDPFLGEQYWVFDVISGQLKASDAEFGVLCLSATSAEGMEACALENKDQRFLLGPEVSRIAAQQELLDFQE